MNRTDLLYEIDNNLFRFIANDEINVFLCGKKTVDQESVRAKVAASFKASPRVNIAYPEWLFPNLLENTDDDLISLENILAEDVDKIILPLEGYGAVCELGAFIVQDKLRDKLIVLNDKSHAIEKSFINLGPLKLLKKKSKGVLILYDKILSDADLETIKSRTLLTRYDHSNRKIGNIFSLTYLVGLLIALFQPIDKKYLYYLIRNWNSGIEIKLVDPAIEALIEYERIKASRIREDKEVFELTEKGSEFYKLSVAYSKRLKQYYKYRSLALWTKQQSRNTFNVAREKARLLESTASQST